MPGRHRTVVQIQHIVCINGHLLQAQVELLCQTQSPGAGQFGFYGLAPVVSESLFYRRNGLFRRYRFCKLSDFVSIVIIASVPVGAVNRVKTAQCVFSGFNIGAYRVAIRNQNDFTTDRHVLQPLDQVVNHHIALDFRTVNGTLDIHFGARTFAFDMIHGHVHSAARGILGYPDM